jgi:hypothetical protein
MTYPTAVWDGDTPNRNRDLAQRKAPNAEDWNVLTAELIGAQNEIESVKEGSSELTGVVVDKTGVVTVGEFATSAVTTAALNFTVGMDVYSDGQLDVMQVHGASGADLTSAYSAKVARFRHVVNVGASGALAHETYGAVGQLVVKETTLQHLHAGLMGTFEGHTSGVIINGSYTFGAAAVLARCGGGAAITATKDLAGVLAFWNDAALASGAASAFAVGDNGTAPWTNAIGVERCTNLLDLPAAGTDPVSAGGTVGTHGTATLKIKIKIGGVDYYLLASTVPTFTE